MVQFPSKMRTKKACLIINCTFATKLERSLMSTAFPQPLPLTASVASGGHPPPLPAGCPLQASSWPNTEPSVWASAAQHPGRPPGVNQNIL